MTKKLCIVDDTPDLLNSIVQFLKMEGFDVLACRNGVEALEKLQHFTPDLIITDVRMPVMNGFEFIETLKSDAHFLHIPVVVFSASPVKADEKEKLKNMVVGYITKPVSMEAFLSSVMNFLNI